MEDAHYNKVQRLLAEILAANWLVAAAKIALGLSIKSAGMTADGFHSLADGASNIVGLIGVRLAARPWTTTTLRHKNSKRFSRLSSPPHYSQSARASSVRRRPVFQSRRPADHNHESCALIVTLLINIAVTIIEYRAGKCGQPDFDSDSMHTRSDVLVSLGVLFSLVGIRLGLPASSTR